MGMPDQGKHDESTVRNEVAASVSGSVVQARDIHIHQPQRALVIPHQLVVRLRLFTGRKHQLDKLTSDLDATGDPGATMVISAIGGAGGIGKTALALHWAHHNIERFPDGQLYVNLRGFDPSGEPMRPEVAVRGFLDALGVEPAAIPVHPDAQAALYRSLVTGRRMLVLLDNARNTEQVEPLLPGSPTCTVLVTSRRRLTGLITLHGANSLVLDVLTKADARELFTRHVGADRVAAEPESVTELLGWCAGLPIAISILGTRAAQHASFPLAVLAKELRSASSSQLDTLDGGELATNLRAVFSWSYQALDREHAEVFGLLGLASGPDISVPAAASPTALPAARVRTVLDELEQVSLRAGAGLSCGGCRTPALPSAERRRRVRPRPGRRCGRGRGGRRCPPGSHRSRVGRGNAPSRHRARRPRRRRPAGRGSAAAGRVLCGRGCNALSGHLLQDGLDTWVPAGQRRQPGTGCSPDLVFAPVREPDAIGGAEVGAGRGEQHGAGDDRVPAIYQLDRGARVEHAAVDGVLGGREWVAPSVSAGERSTPCTCSWRWMSTCSGTAQCPQRFSPTCHRR